MKKILIVVSLFFVASIVSAGWLSDDPFVGFWKQYSGERDGKFYLSQNELSARGYLEVKKNDGSYIVTPYMVSSSGRDSVTKYKKRVFTAISKGDILILDSKDLGKEIKWIRLISAQLPIDEHRCLSSQKTPDKVF